MAESSNSQNDEENELTMMDVLEEEQELEEDANAVLGGSDDTNCSYDKGYLPRQALYSCVTCSNNQVASGVCLACSYKCHDGHDVVELYTKRNFKCDCGNSKFPGKTCTLKPDKEPTNPLNNYNQNFKGLYCICSRPYPDLEDNTPDEMIQCIVCEDWYHGRHIGSVVPSEYFEMICAKCMEARKFLYTYLNKFQYVNVEDNKEEKCNATEKLEDTETEVNKETETPTVHNQDPIKNGCNKAEISDSCVTKVQLKVENEITVDNQDHVIKSIKEETIDTGSPKSVLESENKPSSGNQGHLNGIVKEELFELSKIKVELVDAPADKDIASTVKIEAAVKCEESEECVFKKLIVKPDGINSGAAFWPENWRKELCRCSSCMDMYLHHDCAYLINFDDTIFAYEQRGKSASTSQYDRGLSALGQLDRVKQMEAIRAYTSMKGHLKEYLKEFANNKKTVCESDIKEFFDRMSKRQKLNNSVPHFCR